MITDTNLNFFSVFNFLGVFMGLILSYFFIRKGSRKNIANIIQGLLLLTLTFSIFEEFLNESGYIVQLLWISNFAEPFNFAFAPLFYLFVRSSLKPLINKKDLLHFIPFLFWAAYMIFYFTQSNDVKYNSYIYSKHPDWQIIDAHYPYSEDPLGIRHYINTFTVIHFSIYLFFALKLLVIECGKSAITLLKTDNPKIRNLRNIGFHFILILIIFLLVKLSFPSDVGDHFISGYVSFMIISTGFRILNSSAYFEQTGSFLDIPLMKYKKSTLSEAAKDDLLKRIEQEMTKNKYFLNNMASLSGLSKIIKESTHHVSQVINEKLQMNFFELLADYRVEAAKKILQAEKEKKITIEELADQVGYNSKSAFNNAFKKLTGKTPTDFREST
ncbi:MAG: helix-turn-helix domain-containing protein [Bacteroidota bacterium]